MPSQPSSHSTSKANGVLPVTTAAQTAAGKCPVKVSNPRLKVVIRRLPPGLTEPEFTRILGEEWTVGRGKVDWICYRTGKESRDPSKPSRPSRAYLHLLHSDHLLTLSHTVRCATFEDARDTWNNSCLLGPPSVEFAPYARVPSGKRRNDARRGTIDQDPEFMDFLESLANPVSAKEPAPTASPEEERVKGEAVVTTPLVQFLKEKKANKGKEIAVPAKIGKPTSVKAISKAEREPSPPPEDTKRKGKDVKTEKLVSKAAKEVVNVLSRDLSNESTSTSFASSSTAASTSNTAASTSNSTSTAQESTVKPPRVVPRERGSIAAAARLIQRDLGLSPSNAHRKAKADIAASDAKAASASANESSSASSVNPAAPTGPRGVATTEPRGRGRGKREESAAGKSATSHKDGAKYDAPTVASPAVSAPAVTLLKKPVVKLPACEPASIAASAQTKPPLATQSKAQPTHPTTTPAASMSSSSRQRNSSAQLRPSAGATRAFVKHANPSQGITEALLKEALDVYGATASVEIDKRKGFAYVNFVDADGLVQAMKANPIKIANGTVQVLERRDRESHGGAAARSGAGNVENAGPAGGSGAARHGGRATGARNGRGGAAANASGGAATAGRSKGRHGRGGGGGGGASASTPPSSSTLSTAPGGSTEVGAPQ